MAKEDCTGQPWKSDWVLLNKIAQEIAVETEDKAQ